MTEIPLINDITTLGLLAMVLVLGYYTFNKMFKILTDHLERTVRRQDKMILLLQECLAERPAIQESYLDPPG